MIEHLYKKPQEKPGKKKYEGKIVSKTFQENDQDSSNRDFDDG
jgi:hypothetical protein